MSMTAAARRTGDGLQHEVDVNGRHVLITDEPLSRGGTDTGPAPHELLAACTSTMPAMYANRHDWRLDDLSVDVDYDADAQPRRFNLRANLPAGLSGEQLRPARIASSYRKRNGMIEPVFANTKFKRRGRAAARSEWRLTVSTHNLLKPHTHALAAHGARGVPPRAPAATTFHAAPTAAAPRTFARQPPCKEAVRDRLLRDASPACD